MTSRPPFSDTEVIRRCFDTNRQVLSGVTSGNYVIKLSETVVVKFGKGVSLGEADNQIKAFELLNRTVVRVPRVYRYFEHSGEGAVLMGFLVMEYIHGEIIESPNRTQINQIASMVSRFAHIQNQRPGSLQGGASRGLLWGENREPAFRTVDQMERWLNLRLPDVTSTKLSIRKYPLVLCHLNLAPRNILWLPDGSNCLLDWASAGFYPRFFEVCMLKITEHSHGDYETALQQQMEQLPDDEKSQMLLLSQSFYNSTKHSFVHPSLFFSG